MKFFELVRIAILNLLNRKSRSFFTIFAIAIGMAFVIILLSIGYGLERLVQEQTVGLDALRSIDVDSEQSAVLLLNSDSVNKIKQLEGVETIIPQINWVGKLKLGGSVLDITVLVMDNNYLKYSYKSLVAGKSFAELSSPNLIVNEIIPNILGTKNEDVNNFIGQKAELEIIFPTNIIKSEDGLAIQTRKKDLTIESVVTDRKNQKESPTAYLFFDSLPELNNPSYSKVKVLLSDQERLTEVRAKIEAMGYTTSSAFDTLEQIQTVFTTFRIILMVIGFVGVTIAILGMFNTLTISLLDRMREIGIMKALGTRNSSVFILFFIESITISLLGSILGIILSFVLGFILEKSFQIIALGRGVSPVSFYYTPPYIVFYIILIGLFIGLITGFYPAIRAHKLKPLDALR